VAGTVTRYMPPVLKRVYDQMPELKYVISSVTMGVDQIIPIDSSSRGCPPRPEAPV